VPGVKVTAVSEPEFDESALPGMAASEVRELGDWPEVRDDVRDDMIDKPEIGDDEPGPEIGDGEPGPEIDYMGNPEPDIPEPEVPQPEIPEPEIPEPKGPPQPEPPRPA
jgi:hypothetical protein